MTDQQKQAINEVEKFLNAQTHVARRTNKTYRALGDAVSAARATTGQFAEYASDDEKVLAQKFFEAYQEGGFIQLFHLASSHNLK